MKRSGALGCVLLGAALALCGCSSTLDSLGADPSSNGGGAGVGVGSAGTAGRTLPETLQPVKGPDSYYNAFGVLLRKSEVEIATKIEAAFQQLFYGTSDDLKDEQVIFYQEQTAKDRSLIRDVLHDDVRTEGIGLAMLITVQLGKRDEFDQLWRYSKAVLQHDSGWAKGFFSSFCDEDLAEPCLDSYGMQQFVLALMLADTRWHSSTEMPYAKDAILLLDLFQNGIGDTFDKATYLVREAPALALASFTRSSLEMPAAYWYWGEATGNPFWSNAASAARAHLLASANAKTGLWPMRSEFNAAPARNSPGYGYTEEGYRTQLNLALDALWGKSGPDQVELANRLLDFFESKGMETYGATYSVEGTPILTTRAQALISVNGALAVAASNSNRTAFVNAVWEQAIPTGENRYYEGLLYLMSLLTLSGRLQVVPL
jgi:oligosaccharide reducing-end xylanase